MDILLKEIIQRDLKYSFFFLKFIHLAALGLSYSMWDPFLFVCLFFPACGIFNFSIWDPVP